MPDQKAQSDTRCGFVALIGAPNSGKSTLTNALVGTKVTIVTHKAQTTRGPVRGIMLDGQSQVILVDTPGIFQPKRRLDRAMFATAWERAGDADIVALVIDAKRGIDDGLASILSRLPEVKRPKIAVLNKIDIVAKPDLLRLVSELSAGKHFDQVFMISALTGDGVADLKTYLAQAVPPGPWTTGSRPSLTTSRPWSDISRCSWLIATAAAPGSHRWEGCW